MNSDLAKAVADFIAAREATLEMIERATPGPWHVHGSWVRDANTHGVAITENDRGTKDNATMIALSRTGWPQSIRNEIAMVKGLVSQACLTACYNGHSDGYKPHPNGGLYWENYLSKEAETALRAILNAETKTTPT